MIQLESCGHVRVIRMDEGENRFNRLSVDALHAALDEVEGIDGPCALVTTGSGKFFSNGLDLDWLGAGEGTTGFLESVHRLLGRILGLDVYTVAAVNGHAFAGGAMLASAHDQVVMREDRGYWCLPEVDLGLPLTPAMHAVLKAHLPAPTLAHAALTGHRYPGPEAVAAGIAAEAVPGDAVVERAVEIASAYAEKNRSVLRAHKQLLYGDSIAVCSA